MQTPDALLVKVQDEKRNGFEEVTKLLKFMCDVVRGRGFHDEQSILKDIKGHSDAVVNVFFPDQDATTKMERAGRLRIPVQSIINRVL